MDTEQQQNATPIAADIPDVGTEDLVQVGLGKRMRRLITGLMVVLLVGVSAPWWFGAVEHAWTQIFPPPPYTGSLLFIQDGTHLKALHASDGAVQWTVKGNIGSLPIVATSDMLMYIDDGAIIAVHMTDGSVAWRVSVPQGGYTVPLLQEDAGRLYMWLPSSNGVTHPLLESIDPHSGKVNWRYLGNGRIARLGQSADMQTLIYCDAIFDPDMSSLVTDISVIDTATGVARWTSPPVVASTAQPAECLPIAQQVLLAQYKDTTTGLIAYDRTSGTHLWERELPGTVTTTDATTLYMTTWLLSMPATATHTLTAYDAATGQQRWQLIGNYSELSLNAASFSENIVVMKTPTGIAGIDTRLGKLIWQLQSPGDDLRQWSALHGDGDVILYQDRTTITAVHATKGAVLWRFPLPQTAAQFAAQRKGNQIFFAQHHLYVSEQSKLIAIDPASGKVIWNDTLSFPQVITAP